MSCNSCNGGGCSECNQVVIKQAGLRGPRGAKGDMGPQGPTGDPDATYPVDIVISNFTIPDLDGEISPTQYVIPSGGAGGYEIYFMASIKINVSDFGAASLRNIDLFFRNNGAPIDGMVYKAASDEENLEVIHQITMIQLNLDLNDGDDLGVFHSVASDHNIEIVFGKYIIKKVK